MKAWSFSSLSKFETCPRQYWLTRVVKRVIEPPTAHTEWGTTVHLALENRIRDGTPLPEGMTQYETIAARLAATKGEKHTELQLGLDEHLRPVAFDAPDCWVRCIIDLAVAYPETAFLGDYKTGKVKTDGDQLRLSAAIWMQTYPHKQVRTAYIWLAHNLLTSTQHSRDDLPAIWADFLSRARRLALAYERDKWVPNPSGLCRGWCPAGREHCEFWMPKRQP